MVECRSSNGRSAVEMQSNRIRTVVKSNSNRSCNQCIKNTLNNDIVALCALKTTPLITIT